MDREKVVKGLEALQKSMSENQCYACSHEFVETVKDFGTDIIINALTLLKEQEEEIENLRQTAQSMIEGIVVSKSMFYPCGSCQEYNCDFCQHKEVVDRWKKWH